MRRMERRVCRSKKQEEKVVVMVVGEGIEQLNRKRHNGPGWLWRRVIKWVPHSHTAVWTTCVCLYRCLSVILIHTTHCVSTVESSSVQLRTRWNVPQCTNMGCASPSTYSISSLYLFSSNYPLAIYHPPLWIRGHRRVKRKLCWEIVSPLIMSLLLWEWGWLLLTCTNTS